MRDEKAEVNERLEDTRARFSDKLAELGRRVDALQERTHELQELATKPAVIFGAAMALGIWLGTRGGKKPFDVSTSEGTVRIQPHQRGIVGSLLREVLLVAAGAATRRYINRPPGG
jgi:hypothetical protein